MGTILELVEVIKSVHIKTPVIEFHINQISEEPPEVRYIYPLANQDSKANRNIAALTALRTGCDQAISLYWSEFKHNIEPQTIGIRIISCNESEPDDV